MKKNNKKGFIMAETIVVSVVVLTALVIIYTQFITINNSYYKSFKYNNVDDLYKVNNIRDFVLKNVESNLIDDIGNGFLDITNCDSNYFTEYVYCRTLFTELGVKKVIITKENVTNLDTTIFDEGMTNFIKTIKDTGNNYRIIVEFDNTYATLKFNGIGG